MALHFFSTNFQSYFKSVLIFNNHLELNYMFADGKQCMKLLCCVPMFLQWH